MKNPRDGAEEVLCLWLNSTLGLLLRLVHANRPYLGRSGLPHELTQTMRVIDANRLNDQKLQIGKQIFADLADKPPCRVRQANFRPHSPRVGPSTNDRPVNAP